jgi:HK97 family phage major capsid protein
MGFSDPMKAAALGVWWKLHFEAYKATKQAGDKPASDYIQEANKLERAWGFDPDEKVRYAKAAVWEGPGGGGTIIATPVEAELRRLVRDNSVMRRLATHIVMTSLTHQLPIENANVTGFYIPEGTVITDSMPTTSYAQSALTARKIGGLATVSSEVLNDNIIALQQVVFQQIAEAIGIVEDQGAFNGVNFTGLATVVGRFTSNASGQAVAGNNQGVIPVWPDMVKTIFAGIQRSSRVNGRWFMHPGVYKNLLSSLDTAGQPIVSFSNNYQTPPTGGIPFYVAGFPVELVATISIQDSVFTTSSSVYFCDPTRVLFGDLLGMRFDLDPYGLFTSDQVRIRVLERVGIQIPVGAYISVLQGCRAV